jgi:hypothetical protein
MLNNEFYLVCELNDKHFKISIASITSYDTVYQSIILEIKNTKDCMIYFKEKKNFIQDMVKISLISRGIDVLFDINDIINYFEMS